MRAMLDNVIGIEDSSVVVGSWARDSIERSVSGLDGVLSIDLGIRGREIIQKGFLRAVSSAGLSDRIALIQGLMDGKSHRLSLDDGREFSDLRMDAFEAESREFSGGGISCGCTIKYTQLKSS